MIVFGSSLFQAATLEGVSKVADLPHLLPGPIYAGFNTCGAGQLHLRFCSFADLKAHKFSIVYFVETYGLGTDFKIDEIQCYDFKE